MDLIVCLFFCANFFSFPRFPNEIPGLLVFEGFFSVFFGRGLLLSMMLWVILSCKAFNLDSDTSVLYSLVRCDIELLTFIYFLFLPTL